MRISDWSSDVCASGLECSSTGRAPVSKTGGWGLEPLHSCQIRRQSCRRQDSRTGGRADAAGPSRQSEQESTTAPQNGSASGREKMGKYGSHSVVAVSIKKKRHIKTNDKRDNSE